MPPQLIGLPRGLSDLNKENLFKLLDGFFRQEFTSPIATITETLPSSAPYKGYGSLIKIFGGARACIASLKTAWFDRATKNLDSVIAKHLAERADLKEFAGDKFETLMKLLLIQILLLL